MPPKKINRKRALSNGKDTQNASATKKSRRVSNSKSSLLNQSKLKQKPKQKEEYDEFDSVGEESDSSNGDDDDASEFEAKSDEEIPTDSDQDVEEDISEGSDDFTGKNSSAKARKSLTNRPKSKPSSKAQSLKEKELLREGVTTGLGPGTQVVFKKPKARPPGSIKYTAETVHPNTMLFLGDLAANNSRQWLKMNDPDYRTSLEDWKTFVERLSDDVIEIDETIPELPLKDLFFKIYRDVRFSNDPTPYKNHFSAAWSRTGKKGPFAKYYLQIKPGGSLIAGGLWQPEAQALAAIRRNIDRSPNRIRQVLKNAAIRRDYLGGVAEDEKKIIKSFIEVNKEGALKTKPKGYDGDHRDIEILRLRNFTLHHKLDDHEILGSDGRRRILEIISSLVPFVTYLNEIVMPDDEDEHDD